MASFNLQDYETVDSRIKRFYGDHPEGRITTELVAMDGQPGSTRWVVKASVFRTPEVVEPDGTGYAFEIDGTGMANKTSALENGETSAIGRALANIGYSGDKRASREEMAKTQQSGFVKQVPVALTAAIESAGTVEDLQKIFEANKQHAQQIIPLLDKRKQVILDAGSVG